MNNKASKRLLAASVASLMLVVAFCGFTYAGDDADAEATGEADKPYVKKVVVAKYNTTLNEDGKVEFEIITTQNTTSAGSGITHTGVWKRVANDEPLSNNPESPAIYTHFDICVEISKNTHKFTVKGISTGEETVKLYYELVSAVGGKEIKQKIYYDIVVKVVPALPSGSSEINQSGYVGVEYEFSASGWSSGFIYEAGLMFYAENLPDGLSMNIDGTITGVPKQSVESNAMITTVTIHNGTGFTKSYQIKWTILDQVASLDAEVILPTDPEDKSVQMVTDDRYIVKKGTEITVEANVDGFLGGVLTIDTHVFSTISSNEVTAKITLDETGERLIEVAYTFDMDGSSSSPDVKIVDYITVVVIDVVEDATTGMGLVAGDIDKVLVPTP